MKVGYLVIEGATVEANNALAEQELTAAERQAKSQFSDPTAIASHPVLKGIRMLFSRVGIDPTKERPSGEALIRRAVKGTPIYRINSAVDVNNASSISNGHPCGVYDAEKLVGDRIIFGIGTPEDRYEGITGRIVNADSRLVSIDGQSIFGAPTADSERTKVTGNTRTILMLIYHPAETPEHLLRETLDAARNKLESVTRGRTVQLGIYTVA